MPDIIFPQLVSITNGGLTIDCVAVVTTVLDDGTTSHRLSDGTPISPAATVTPTTDLGDCCEETGAIDA